MESIYSLIICCVNFKIESMKKIIRNRLKIIEQNFKNWNLIIVDDNSNNENKEILKKYDYHKNIKIKLII